MSSCELGRQCPHPNDKQGAHQDNGSPRILCLLWLHLLHGMLGWNSRAGHVVVYQAHQHVWGCAFSAQCLYDEELILQNHGHTPVHQQGSALVIPWSLSWGASNDWCLQLSLLQWVHDIVAFVHWWVDELVAEQVLPRFYDPPSQARSIQEQILFNCGWWYQEANHVEDQVSWGEGSPKEGRWDCCLTEQVRADGVLEDDWPSAWHDVAHSLYGKGRHGQQRLLRCNGSDCWLL